MANTNFCGCGNDYPIVPGTNPALQTWNGQSFVVADGSAQNPIRLPFLQVNGGSATYVVGADNNGTLSYYNPLVGGYATNLLGGLAGQLPIQTAPSTTGFIYPNNVLVTATGSSNARTLANRFADAINVKDYGATGNGTTDDTAAINSALSSILTTGGNIIVPEGTYLISGTLRVPSNTTMLIGGQIKMANGVALSMIGNSNPQLGNTGNSVPSSISYTNTNIHIIGFGSGVLNGNAQNIGKKSPIGTATSDPVGLYNGDVGNLQNSPYYRARCINMIGVNNCSVQNLTILDAAETTVWFRNCANVVCTGNIINTGNGNGMSGLLVNNAANGQNQGGIQLENCIDGTVANNVVSSSDDCIAITALGLGPAGKSNNITITGNSCHNKTVITAGQVMNGNGTRVTRAYTSTYSDQILENITIIGNNYRGGGGGVLIGENSASFGSQVNAQVNNQIIVEGNTISDLNELGSATYCIYVYGSAGFNIDNNTIANITGRSGIQIVNSINGILDGNLIQYSTDAVSIDETAIYSNDQYGNVYNIQVNNNRVVDSPSGGIQFLNYLNPSYNINNIAIVSNFVTNTNSASQSGASQEYNYAGIRLLNIGNVKITENNLDACKAVGIFVRDCYDVDLTENTVRNSQLGSLIFPGVLIDVSTASSNELYVNASSNSITGSNGVGLQISDALNLNLVSNFLSGNNLKTTGSAEVYINLYLAGVGVSAGGVISNNSISCDGTKSTIGIFAGLAGSATSTKSLTWGQNYIVGATFPLSRQNVLYCGNVQLLGTAFPTTGTWRQGDIVYNTSAAASGTIGWVCTTGGTSGTWKTWGAISA